jgi:hypothetical protein
MARTLEEQFKIQVADLMVENAKLNVAIQTQAEQLQAAQALATQQQGVIDALHAKLEPPVAEGPESQNGHHQIVAEPVRVLQPTQ